MVDDNALQAQLVGQFEFATILTGLGPEPLFDEVDQTVNVRLVLLPVRQTASSSQAKRFQSIGLAFFHEFNELR